MTICKTPRTPRQENEVVGKGLGGLGPRRGRFTKKIWVGGSGGVGWKDLKPIFGEGFN